MTVSNLLSRIEVASFTGHWPPTLVHDIRAALVAGLSAYERREHRNQLLRKAAELLPDSSYWVRAETLARIIARWSGQQQADPIKRLLFEAQSAFPLPTTARQIYGLLKPIPFKFQ